jgi:hypothetical protein
VGKTPDELIAFLKGHGYEVTKNQLRRWYTAGLFSKPDQLHVKGVKGSVSRFPEGVESPVLAVCALHFEQGKKSLKDIRGNLWWQRYAVDLAQVRRDLIATLAPVGAIAKSPKGKKQGVINFAEATAENLLAQARHPVRRAIVRRLGEDEAREFLVAIISLILSKRAPDWLSGNGETNKLDVRRFEGTIRRGLGVDGLTEPLNGDDIQQFRMVLRTLLDPREILTHVDDGSLNRARDDARVMIEGFTSLSAILQTTGADRVLHLEGLRHITSETMFGRALAILAMLAISETMPRETIDQILTPLATHAPTYRKLAHILNDQAEATPQARVALVLAVLAVQPIESLVQMEESPID